MALRPNNVIERDPVREFTGDHRALTHSVLMELQRARDAAAHEIAAIECKTFDEYRWRFGKREGLDIAIEICKRVQSKLEA